MRIPVEGFDHRLSIDRQGSQVKPFFPLGEVMAKALTNARESQHPDRPIELFHPIKFLVRGHPTITLYEQLLDIPRGVALARTHDQKYRPIDL